MTWYCRIYSIYKDILLDMILENILYVSGFIIRFDVIEYTVYIRICY